MFWKLLLDEAASEPANNNGGGSAMILVLFGLIIAAFIVIMFFSGRKSKQSNKEYVEMLDAIGPGNKVRTAGGICGIVVEVCEDNTVIIETGSETSGRSYIKMDKELIMQSDAKGPTQIAREEEEARKAAEKAAKNPNAKPVLPEEKSEEKSEEK